MRAKEIREFSIDEMRQKEREIAEEIFRLRMRKSTGQLDNPMRLRLLRRDLARVKTIQQQRATQQTGE
ncbi:MAG: 50S ribosomal protein L29 [Candidatus Binatia bacterium]